MECNSQNSIIRNLNITHTSAVPLERERGQRKSTVPCGNVHTGLWQESIVFFCASPFPVLLLVPFSSSVNKPLHVQWVRLHRADFFAWKSIVGKSCDILRECEVGTVLKKNLKENQASDGLPPMSTKWIGYTIIISKLNLVYGLRWSSWTSSMRKQIQSPESWPNFHGGGGTLDQLKSQVLTKFSLGEWDCLTSMDSHNGTIQIVKNIHNANCVDVIHVEPCTMVFCWRIKYNRDMFRIEIKYVFCVKIDRVAKATLPSGQNDKHGILLRCKTNAKEL